MPTIEERVAALEGWKESLSLDIQDLKDRMLRLEQRMDHIDKKIDSVRDDLYKEIRGLDMKIDSVGDDLHKEIRGLDIKIDSVRDDLYKEIRGLDIKIDSVRDDLHKEIRGLDIKIDSVRTEIVKKVDIQFRWLVGFQFAVLLSIVALLMRMLFV